MRKLSWPYIGDSELEMGSMSPTGDAHRDIHMDAQPRYDMMVAQISTTPEGQAPVGYSGGMFFPAEDLYSEMEDDEYQALASLSKKFMQLLRRGSTVLGVGEQTEAGAAVILKAGHNLINLSKNATSKVNLYNFHQEYGNPMFHTIRNKFDGFYVTCAPSDKGSLEITLGNIGEHLRPVSCGFVVTSDSTDISSSIEKLGFIIIDKHIGKVGKYIVSQNNLNKTAVVRC